jgi:hypothetical protein
MTADMPDAVIVAREALAKKYDETGWHDQAAYIRDAGNLDTDPLKFAILGARAMQDAMAGRVRVKPMDLSNVLNAAFNFGLSGGKWEDFSLDAHPGYRRILSALEPSGAQEGAASPIAAMAATLQAVADEGVFAPDPLAQEGAGDQQPSGAIWGRAAREASAKTPDILVDVVNAELAKRAPTPAPDVPWLVERLNRKRALYMGHHELINPDGPAAADALETLRADHHRRGVKIIEMTEKWGAEERRATAAEAERNALKVAAEHNERVIAGLNKQLTGEIAATSALAKALHEAGAEITALKAEVERKDKALAVVREQATRTDEIALALLAQINPHVDLAEGPSQLFFSLHDQIKVQGPAALHAALPPAKAGG